ncbi:MAG TPA: TetR/AcrR family transcriptional regulator [Pseudonocardia sp.]|uniref:TetR/AcrR family transcriptional regulator n=1 Tax=Pseudonocardia sp. TaxID=60912 RepID=UPI002F3F2385
MSTPARRRPGRPRKMPAEEQRELILRGARTAFAGVGRSAATIEQIAETSGVTRQAVYEQFGGKDALFDATVHQLLAELLAAVGPLPEAEVETRRGWAFHMLAVVYTMFRDVPETFALFKEAQRVGNPEATPFLDKLRVMYADTLRVVYPDPELGHTADVVAGMVIGMVEALLTMDHPRGAPGTDIAVDLIREFVQGGIGRLRESPGLVEALR